MKRSVLIVLCYMVLLQFVMPLLVMIPYALIQLVQTGQTHQEALLQQIAVPSHLATAVVILVVSVWHAFRRGRQLQLTAFVQPRVLVAALVAMASSVLLIEPLLSGLNLPDTSGGSFNLLLSNVVGVLAVGVIGPIAEELVFRKHVMAAMSRYTPAVRILFSAFLFGIFHINPAQVLPAFILGLLLAWVYERSGSILLTCVMHIVNNSASMWLMSHYGKSIEILPSTLHWGVRSLAYLGVFLLLVGSLRIIARSSADR